MLPSMSVESDLLKCLIKTIYVQHQDFIPQDDYSALLRRFALGYRLQQDLGIFSEEEWGIIIREDLPHFFQTHPEAICVWKSSLRKFWTSDIQQFIDGIANKAGAD